MMTERPATLIDPVCGMKVDVAAAEAQGLLLEYEGRTYGFCRAGCKRAFVEEPAEYARLAETQAASAAAAQDEGHGAARPLPIIDEGIRRWYESCPCCLSETYPEIKAQLDAEAAAHGHGHAGEAPVAAAG